QPPNLNTTTSNNNNSPYLDFNLNTNYTGSMLNQPTTPSCAAVPNMFTAAAVAAANSGALCNQTGVNTTTKTTQSSNLNNNDNQNSDFPFSNNNNNNNLTKK